MSAGPASTVSDTMFCRTRGGHPQDAVRAATAQSGAGRRRSGNLHADHRPRFCPQRRARPQFDVQRPKGGRVLYALPDRRPARRQLEHVGRPVRLEGLLLGRGHVEVLRSPDRQAGARRLRCPAQHQHQRQHPRSTSTSANTLSVAAAHGGCTLGTPGA